jgi:hypothetical protein
MCRWGGGSLPPGYATAPKLTTIVHPVHVFLPVINISAMAQLLGLEERLVLLLCLDESLLESVGVCSVSVD